MPPLHPPGPRDLGSTAYRRSLIVVFFLALGLRLATAHAFHGLCAPPDVESNPDQLDYEAFASQMSRGVGYCLPDGTPTARRPPGTSLALLPIYEVFERSYLKGRLWFCLLSALTVLSTAWLARLCFGRWVSLLSAIWLCGYPGHFYYSIHFLSEVPYGLWLSLSGALAVRAMQGGRRLSALGAGLTLGMAILTRPQITPLLALAPLAALVAEDSKRALRVACLVVASALAVLAPWLARNAVVLGQPTLTTIGGITFWGGNNEVVARTPEKRGFWIPVHEITDDFTGLPPEELPRESVTWNNGLEYLRSHPFDVPVLLASKLGRFLTPFESTENRVVYWTFGIAWILTGPLVLIGFVIARHENRQAVGMLLLPILATLVSVFVFYGSIRFRDSLCPLFVIPAAYATWVLVGERVLPGRAAPEDLPAELPGPRS